MLTILNAVELSADYLKKKGVELPRINAELLLAHVLKCKRMDLYLKFDQPLTTGETTSYREAIKRRGLREPLQYITGTVEFYGLEFKVNKNVLIPRQETEILVEEVIKNTKTDEGLKILDIGTGSGNISISLAKNLPKSKIVSIDINERAIEIANINAVNNNINRQIDFRIVDFNNFTGEKFDVIVSNPPYISEHEYTDLEQELKKYEPKEALTDYSDGFSFYRLIAGKSKDLLNKHGKLFFEFGYGQSEKIIDIMENKGLHNCKIIKDYQNINRVIYGEIE